jgi:hypothetical protein
MRFRTVLEMSSVLYPTLGTSPGEVVLVVGSVSSGDGDVRPTEGISPATAESDRKQVSAAVIRMRFMGVLL